MTDQNLTGDVPHIMTLRLVGGWLCLDFANTVSGRDRETRSLRSDYLQNYVDLVLWANHAGILPKDGVQPLLEEAACHPLEAEVVLQQGRTLREAIYRIFSEPLYGNPIPSESLEILNTVLAKAMSHSRISEEDQGHFEWSWAEDAKALDRVLWDVVRSAADLLTSEHRLKVRECDSPTCNWLFEDSSKNHHRRWCSMEECGNRAKVRKHRHKHQTN